MANNLANFKTIVAASTISFAGIGVAPNVFARRPSNSPNIPYVDQRKSAPSTALSQEEQATVQDSLDRTKAILRDEETSAFFHQLRDEWVQDAVNVSDVQVSLIHPSYHKILALGTSILPFIFDDMANGDGARWLPALDAITLGRVNPILPEHEDDAELMCQDWLEWARAHDLIKNRSLN